MSRMEKKYKIACVVVTYNRKRLLKRCLDAIQSQTYKPFAVYILDNASSDGTLDSVKSWSYYNCENNGIIFKYILNNKNEGGAGGFYKGMKAAFHDDHYDALWVMDDDGEPANNCLENLLHYLPKYDYIAPIVLSDEKRDICAFTFKHESLSEFSKKAENGLVKDFASPFNGILYSHKLIKKVGFPKKEMFIWGDEINMHLRCKSAGFIPVTVINAVHYHPLNKQEYVYYKKSLIIYIESPWKLYCYFRNATYNLKYTNYKFLVSYICIIYRFIRMFFIMLKYISYYKKIRNKNYSLLLIDAYFSGIFGRFSGLSKYFVVSKSS